MVRSVREEATMTVTAETTSDTSEGSARTKHRAVDLDGHFVEPESLWDEYLPKQHREWAPRMVPDTLGRMRYVIADEALPYVAWAGPQFAQSPIDNAAKPPEGSGSDPAVRLAVMDAEGVDVHLMYPTVGLHFGAIENIDASTVLCRAYNDWASDFCQAAPDRFVAHALLPQRSVTETRHEIDRAVGQLGLRAVFLRPNPLGRHLEDPAWDSVWSQIEDYDVPLGIHEGTGPVFPRFGSDRTDNFMFEHAMSHPFEHMAAMASFVAGGILERHPNLRVSFAEAGCGWVPYWLERLDDHAAQYSYQAVKLSLRPSEYFQRQCIVTMDSTENRVVPAFVSCLGPDALGWSTDFPHPDHTWKGMVGQLMDRTDLAEDDKVKIIGANAARVYKL
jgi:predicted TIM-barrel fold metal-dependent hydrolase